MRSRTFNSADTERSDWLGVASGWPLWMCTRLVAVCLIVGLISYPALGTWGDVHLYAQWSAAFWHGSLPYRDWNLEYPPGALLVAILPHPSAAAFHFEFLAAALAADAVGLVLLRRTGRRVGAALWVFAALLLGPIFLTRLDIFVGVALVGAIVGLESKRYVLATVLVTFAGLLKLWPVLLLVFVFVAAPKPARRRVLAAVAATIGTFVLPVLAYGGSFRALAWTLRFQQERGLEIESVPAGMYYLRHLFGGSLVARPEYGTYQLVAGHTAAVQTGCFVVMIGMLGMVAWRFRNHLVPDCAGDFTLVCVAVLLLTSKVLSPQYLVWAVAALAVSLDKSPAKKSLIVWSSGAMLLTQVLYPFAYFGLVRGSLPAAVSSVLHAVALVGFASVACRLGAASGRTQPALTEQHHLPPRILATS